MRRMTRDQLAERLRTVNAMELSRASGIAAKTIYRLREKANAPTLDTVQRLLDGMRKMGKVGARKTAPTTEKVAA